MRNLSILYMYPVALLCNKNIFVMCKPIENTINSMFIVLYMIYICSIYDKTIKHDLDFYDSMQ